MYDILVQIYAIIKKKVYKLLSTTVRRKCSRWSLCVFVQVRSGCAFMVHVCQDEHQLYNEFFSKPTPKLEWVAPEPLVTWSLNTQRAGVLYLFKVWLFKMYNSLFKFDLLCLVFEIPIYTAWVDNFYYFLRGINIFKYSIFLVNTPFLYS